MDILARTFILVEGSGWSKSLKTRSDMRTLFKRAHEFKRLRWENVPIVKEVSVRASFRSSLEYVCIQIKLISLGKKGA